MIADQGGVTGTETNQQIFNLFLPNLFLSYAGNPNGNLAGVAYQTCWDTIDLILYVCTRSGTTSSAVWNAVTTSTNTGLTPNNVTTSSINMMPNNSYVCNNSGGSVTLTLPVTAAFGSIIYVIGRLTGWSIHQNAGQQIFISPASTTSGTGGSVSSTNARDTLLLQCTVANTEWTALAMQNAGLTIV